MLIAKVKLGKEKNVIHLVIMSMVIVKDVIEMELVLNVLMINIKVSIVKATALIVQMVYAP